MDGFNTAIHSNHVLVPVNKKPKLRLGMNNITMYAENTTRKYGWDTANHLLWTESLLWVP